MSVAKSAKPEWKKPPKWRFQRRYQLRAKPEAIKIEPCQNCKKIPTDGQMERAWYMLDERDTSCVFCGGPTERLDYEAVHRGCREWGIICNRSKIEDKRKLNIEVSTLPSGKELACAHELCFIMSITRWHEFSEMLGTRGIWK